MRSAQLLWWCAAIGVSGVIAAPVLAQPDAGTPDAGVSADDDEDWDDEEDAEYRDAYTEEDAEDEDETAGPVTEEELDEEEDAEEAEAQDAEDEAAAEEEEAEEGDAEEGDVAPTRPTGAGFTLTLAEPPPEPAADDFDLTLPPIFHYHRHAQTTTTAVFPLFYLREDPTYSELVIPPFYHREGLEPFDVLFPIFWWYRGAGHHTWIAGPVWHHEDATSHDFGIAPLVFSGRHEDRYYHLLPPLLTLAWGDEDEDYLSAAALFYRFRVRESEHWGVFPLLWVHNSPGEEYQFIPPLFFRWRNPETQRTLTVVPPVYLHEDPGETFWGIAGLLHHDEGPGFHGTTIPPLLFHFSEEHFSEGPDTFRLATPAFLYMNERGSETLVTLFYQRYRGLTELDMVLPLFLWARDPRDRSETLMASPLVWHWGDPGRDNWVVFPFFLHLDDRGRNTTWFTPLVGSITDHERHDETTWVFPTTQISRWHDGDAVHIHPIFYYESVPSHRYAVFAPFWWDFEQFEGGGVAASAAPVPVDEGEAPSADGAAASDSESDDGETSERAATRGGAPEGADGFGIPVQRHTRYTVAFPFYYRIHEAETETQILLTTYFRRRDWPHENRWEWEFHGSGLFDFGERSDGEHWWRVLYGLIGWEHRRDHDRLWLFYIPIDFGHADTSEGAPSPASTAALPLTETRD